MSGLEEDFFAAEWVEDDAQNHPTERVECETTEDESTDGGMVEEDTLRTPLLGGEQIPDS